nr:TIGR04222 domain-containing membrane protein [Amycolatopsis azurea]
MWRRWRRGLRRMNRLETIYQVAYLIGGPDRVTDTAVAGALERKAARLDRSGVLHRSSVKPTDPFVLAVVESLPKVRAERVREVLREPEPMRSLRAELLAAGLVVPTYHWRRAWHAATRTPGGVWATRAGERLLAEAREDPRLVTGARGAVALGGLGAYPDRRSAWLLTAPTAGEKARVTVSSPDDGQMDVTDCSPG